MTPQVEEARKINPKLVPLPSTKCLPISLTARPIQKSEGREPVTVVHKSQVSRAQGMGPGKEGWTGSEGKSPCEANFSFSSSSSLPTSKELSQHEPFQEMSGND